ncbi:MAG: hypothetical protein KGY66_06150 [Candidatus Thermoplasmatota archaeon]|nr:hypothetical protein [Candidatus Thermoplasmatota archaeon]MBS3790480.1 hypothetical protein [Candidatus Thermoplasmatota archaeon]
MTKLPKHIKEKRGGDYCKKCYKEYITTEEGYKITFSDLFYNKSKDNFNISEYEICESIKNYDKKQILNFEEVEKSLIGSASKYDTIPEFYLKSIDSKELYYLVSEPV